MQAVGRRAQEEEHERAEGTLCDGRDLGDHDRASKARGRRPIAHPERETPHTDRGVVKDEDGREPTVQRQHEVHARKAKGPREPMLVV